MVWAGVSSTWLGVCGPCCSKIIRSGQSKPPLWLVGYRRGLVGGLKMQVTLAFVQRLQHREPGGRGHLSFLSWHRSQACRRSMTNQSMTFVYEVEKSARVVGAQQPRLIGRVPIGQDYMPTS